jgi:hypothetical protein
MRIIINFAAFGVSVAIVALIVATIIAETD